MSTPFDTASPKVSLQKLSIVIPARDEAGCIASTVEHLALELRLNDILHEIIVVDDCSNDGTWQILTDLTARIPALVPIKNAGENGFGRAIICGLDRITGDAVVIMMADESDDCRDVVRYWKLLNEGWDCVFGSRFIKGGGVIDYPKVKLVVNRLANIFISVLFGVRLNDTTNAFKAYRKTVIEGCRPLISPHFNLTIEIPLKAIVRGYSWAVMPITWRNFLVVAIISRKEVAKKDSPRFGSILVSTRRLIIFAQRQGIACPSISIESADANTPPGRPLAAAILGPLYKAKILE